MPDEPQAEKQEKTSLPTPKDTAPATPSDEPAQPHVSEPDVSRFAEAMRDWRADLAEAAREDALVAAKLGVPLTNAHPGGLASLYADAPTLLSSLVREPTALAQAESSVGALSDFAQTLEDRHGTVTVHLSVGYASWQGLSPAVRVPVLMRQVLIEQNEGEGVSLQLLPGVEVSSRLLTETVRAGGYLDQEALADALDGPHGFSPAAALDVVRQMSQVLPGFELEDSLALGILTHPSAPLFHDVSDETFMSSSPLMVAVAEGKPLGSTNDLEIIVNPADRDPWKEIGLGDQSPQVQDVVEAITDGGSYVVKPEDGSDVVGFVTSISGAFASEGKRVLVVASDPKLEGEIGGRFAQLGVSSIVGDFFSGNHDGVASALEDAMRDASPQVDTEAVERLRTSLRRARESLSSYEEQLHKDFADWGVSPFDALQVLTDLTSDPDGPSTRVRLGVDALSALAEDGGLYARDLLETASAQGLFAEDVDRGPWSEVRLEDSAQVETVLGAVETLATEALPAVRMQIATISGQSGLRSATTLAGWGEALQILQRVRAVLDQFRPEIFERSPSDLVVATATPEWRQERGINLKNSKRRQVIKAAKDLVRPGVHIPDLHGALVEAQECRQQWIVASAAGDAWPLIPEGLDRSVETLMQTQKQISLVAPYLQETFGDLQTMPLDELCPILETLAADPNSARLVPGHLQVREELQSLGLGELVNDFKERRIDGELLGLELDLSWWASALGMMLAAEPRLGGFDPEVLQGALAEVRALDKAQVETLGPLLVERVRARRREVLALYPDQYTEMVAALAEQRSVPSMFADFTLAWDMLPIVCAGPALVPHLVKRRRTVDVIVAVGMEDLPLGELAPVLARGNQAIIVKTAGQSSNLEAFAAAMPTVELPARRVPSTGPLTDLVVTYHKETTLLAAPSPRPHMSIGYVLAEGSGMPAPGQVAVASSLGEADAVSNLLAQTLTEDPEQSVAVVALSDLHADRIRSTLRRMTVTNPELRDALEARGGDRELIVSAARLREIRPNHVILSVGFAKTPHGRVIHDFGDLSTDGGMALWEDLAAGTPKDLTVVTTLRSEEIDAERLKQPGAQALVALLALAEGKKTGLDGGQSGQEAPDDLLVDLADRLHRLGLPVVPNLGAGPLRVPLAVGHPEVPGELLVAVLTDNPQYREEPSLRLRDRWIPEELESLGWKVRTELSMAVFIDPNLEAQKIVDLVLDAVDEHYVATGRPVTPAAAQALGSGDPFGELPEGVQETADFMVEDDFDAVYVSTDTGMIEQAELPQAEASASDVSAPDPAPASAPASDVPAPEMPAPDPTPAPEMPAPAAAPDAPAPDPTPAPEPALLGGFEEPLFERVAEFEPPELLESETIGELEAGVDSPEPTDLGAVSLVSEDDPEQVVPAALTLPADAGPPAPSIAQGLPLAAYSDDQLDEVAQWVWQTNPDATKEEVVEEIRGFIGLKRRGMQSDTILLNVAGRTKP